MNHFHSTIARRWQQERVTVLVVGGGGREHALVWKLSQSPRVEQLYAAPGNAGTAALARNLPISASNIQALKEAALSLHIDLTVVGPEAPLAAGIADEFAAAGLPLFGPSRAAAQIEASKVFSRELMEKYGIPCPQGRVFSSYQEARSFVESLDPPIVVKADGLATGKGVLVVQSREEAWQALGDIMVKKAFGAAGERVIVDEYLSGREVSLLAFTDGQTVVPLVTACDYKRAYDDDQGPNTGGMGGYAPAARFPPSLVQQAMATILEPAVTALAREGRPYRGVLYAGLMVTEQGTKVLEFNCRFGDPETQVILPLLGSDLLEIMLACVQGTLNGVRVEWSSQSCVGVVLASGGYPGSYRTGYPISGLAELPSDILVFHAGTRREGDHVVTDGGRVLCVAAVADALPRAREMVYQHLPRLHFEGCFHRKDIAQAGVTVCP